MGARAKSRVPIALPVVRIRFDDAGAGAVTVDKEPYPTPAGFGRGDVHRFVQALADQFGPIRVELSEADGETYIDIETPRDQQSPSAAKETTLPTPSAGGRFAPGEPVSIAVVVGRSEADDHGEVRLNLPAGLLLRYGDDVILIGEDSRRVVGVADPGRRGAA